MKRLLDRAYAAQRLASFQKAEPIRRSEVVRDAGWAMFFLIVVCALLLSGWLG